LLDVLIANYNATRHSGIGKRTPLAYAKLLFESSQADFRTADLSDIESLLSVRKLCIVRGGAEVGRGLYVECNYARYTNETLQNRQDLVGKKIWVIHHKEDDARIALASTQDGVSLGVLRAAPPWHVHPHSLAIRRAIARAQASGKFDIPAGGDGISTFLDFVEAQPGNKLPIHPAYLEARRILSRAADQFVGETTLQAAQERAGIILDTSSDKNSAKLSATASANSKTLRAQQSTVSEPAGTANALPPRRMAANRSKDEPK